ncbi:DNA translocase FtsK [Paenibacillus polymyxa]|uniref:DNA translocase FtsK n=1 Tax=Paenibacillus polymyxa TaxID=1406 RepID=UPI002905939D|nr:DNA translocase FtsK [Paenibacillus polymyxa]MEE4581059.1 DNA translocase FtsK [Paenibacillus polymyxa]
MKHTEHSNEGETDQKKEPPKEDEDTTSYPDDLFLKAVQIVAEAKQASVSLLQMKIRYSIAIKLIDELERCRLIGTYRDDKPREVYLSHLQLMRSLKS